MVNQQSQNYKILIEELENEAKEHKIEKMKFCIVSCYKNQMIKNKLLMFTLDNTI